MRLIVSYWFLVNGPNKAIRGWFRRQPQYENIFICRYKHWLIVISKPCLCCNHRNNCRCICQIILKLCQEHGSDIASLCSNFQKRIWQMTNSYGSTKFNEIWFNNVVTVITSAFNVSITDRCSTEDANISSATGYLVGHLQLCSQISEFGSKLIWNAKQRV